MEYLPFEDNMDWDYINSIPPNQRIKKIPLFVEQMFEWCESRTLAHLPKDKRNGSHQHKGIGYWTFRRLLQLQAKYREALLLENEQEELFYEQLFRKFEARVANNYGKFGTNKQKQTKKRNEKGTITKGKKIRGKK